RMTPARNPGHTTHWVPKRSSRVGPGEVEGSGGGRGGSPGGGSAAASSCLGGILGDSRGTGSPSAVPLPADASWGGGAATAGGSGRAAAGGLADRRRSISRSRNSMLRMRSRVPIASTTPTTASTTTIRLASWNIRCPAVPNRRGRCYSLRCSLGSAGVDVLLRMETKADKPGESPTVRKAPPTVRHNCLLGCCWSSDHNSRKEADSLIKIPCKGCLTHLDTCAHFECCWLPHNLQISITPSSKSLRRLRARRVRRSDLKACRRCAVLKRRQPFGSATQDVCVA